MSVLNGFPLISQQTKISADGSSPNANNDCVPTSLLAGIMYLLGITQLSQEWNPDKLLDMAYPEGYTGGTMASHFIDACKSLGVHIWPVDGDNASLVQQAHQYLAQGKPVVFTIVDPYMPASSGYTHVCVWFSDATPGTLTAMDPWPGKPVTHSDAEWEAVMRFNEIWIMEKTSHPTQSQGDLPMLQLSDPMGQFFTPIDDNHWHCNLTNVDLIYGHLTFYRQHQGIFGLPRLPEVRLASMPGTAIMVYERAIAIYDPDRIATHEAPPGAGQVYLMHVDGGGTAIGQQQIAKPLLAALQAEVSQLQAQLANGPSVQLQAQVAAYQAAIKQVAEIVHALVTA